MKKNTSRKLVTWLLVASTIWWTSGCYTMREIEKLSDAGGRDIEVSTKGHNSYTLHEWTVDTLGTIRGNVVNPAFRSVYDRGSGVTVSSGEPMYLGQYSLPRDSVATMRAEAINVPLTVATGTVVLAGAALITCFVLRLAALNTIAENAAKGLPSF